MIALADRLNNLKQAFFNNPILIKEMRIGLREKKVFIIQTIYMLVLGVVAFWFILEVLSRPISYYDQESGRTFFKILCIFQWFLIIMIAPSLTSTALSSEKEKKTYDMLLVTLLSASDIIIGKLGYAAAYIILLLASSLPLVALVFFIGGVAPIEILINYIGLLAWGILVASLALFFSSREYRSSVATSQSYGALFLLGFTITGFYLPHFWETGLFIGYNLKTPNLIMWLAIYFDLIWAFLFLFYKTANNVRPKASHILALHRMFIVGFLINCIGVLAGAFVLSRQSSSGLGFLNSFGDEEIATLWNIFSMTSIFLMGCFIERQAFLSQKEEAILARSITSKRYFFPLYFLMAGLLIAILFVIFAKNPFKVLTSYALFAFFLWVMVGLTNELYVIFREKFRPVLIYYPLLLIINLFPLFSWIVASNTPGYNKVLGLLSFIYLHPVFTILSIWNPDGEFGMIKLAEGLKVPTFTLTLVVYVGLFILVKMISMLLGKLKEEVH